MDQFGGNSRNSKDQFTGNPRKHYEEKSADFVKFKPHKSSGMKSIDFSFDESLDANNCEKRERQRRKPEKPEKRPPPSVKSSASGADVLGSIIRDMGSNSKSANDSTTKNYRAQTSSFDSCRAPPPPAPQPQFQPVTAPNLSIPLTIVTKPSANHHRGTFPPQSPGISPMGPGSSGIA